ncbi:hypothetical protein AG1IA_07307 [Rhizoctonia solani AG-1 IA]|uniref:Uncharacterized protein n=1 Tax=Thanatephorus cucumeris (strain AG1-IA) TaxID=983506 RepID=L8WPH2_THACA|nr:hypothetical protein AG1IA_07307 [Rhizoctonia solani AG-1 IA]
MGGNEMVALGAYLLHGLSGCLRASSSSAYARPGNELCNCFETCKGAKQCGIVNVGGKLTEYPPVSRYGGTT